MIGKRDIPYVEKIVISLRSFKNRAGKARADSEERSGAASMSCSESWGNAVQNVFFSGLFKEGM